MGSCWRLLSEVVFRTWSGGVEVRGNHDKGQICPQHRNHEMHRPSQFCLHISRVEVMNGYTIKHYEHPVPFQTATRTTSRDNGIIEVAWKSERVVSCSLNKKRKIFAFGSFPNRCPTIVNHYRHRVSSPLDLHLNSRRLSSCGTSSSRGRSRALCSFLLLNPFGEICSLRNTAILCEVQVQVSIIPGSRQE